MRNYLKLFVSLESDFCTYSEWVPFTEVAMLSSHKPTNRCHPALLSLLETEHGSLSRKTWGDRALKGAFCNPTPTSDV